MKYIIRYTNDVTATVEQAIEAKSLTQAKRIAEKGRYHICDNISISDADKQFIAGKYYPSKSWITGF